jgi:glucose/arabinose dehydrogenase
MMHGRTTLALALALTGGSLIGAQTARQPPCDAGNGGLTLPAGFCAAIVADNLGAARHMTFSPRGDLYVLQETVREDKPPGSVIALRDKDGDGQFEQQQRFGPGLNGTDIKWRENYLYVGSDTRLVRYRMSDDALVPAGEPEVIVGGFPDQRQHSAKPFAFGGKGELYVHVGAPSNACQSPDRQTGVPGQQPCALLQMHGGIWKYDANTPNQKHAADKRVISGIRHIVGLAWNPANGSLYGVQHGRDQLDTMWPKSFTPADNAEKPAEEFLKLTDGTTFSWPYCYWDPAQNKRVLSPEYGGDGKKEGDCARYPKPVASLPAHMAPNDLLFYTGTQFPQEYRNGAFVAFHGSWNRAPLPQKGYSVWFVPFKGGEPAGDPRVFAEGFAGALLDPRRAAHRPTGLALARDGSLYVSDDTKGTIWRISHGTKVSSEQ